MADGLRPTCGRAGAGSPGGSAVVTGVTSVEVTGNSETVVGTGDVLVTWVLATQPDSSMGAAVRTNGPDAEINDKGKVVQARFVAGQGDRWEVWLDGVEDSRVTLVRKPEPTVKIGYRHDGGALTMVETKELTLPPGNLTLEFFFDQAMDPETLAPALHETYQQAKNPDGGRVKTEWVNQKHARWVLPAVPSRLELALGGLRASTGLLLVPRPLVVRSTETQPYLERINPATGQKERLMALPPEIKEVRLSPESQYLAMQAFEQRPDRQNGW